MPDAVSKWIPHYSVKSVGVNAEFAPMQRKISRCSSQVLFVNSMPISELVFLSRINIKMENMVENIMKILITIQQRMTKPTRASPV